MTRVMVFGAFDGLHPGHEHFLAEAKTYGQTLIVALATDSTIARQKGHAPQYGFDARKAALMASGLVDDVVKGDEEAGIYSAAQELVPDVVVFGYDQAELRSDFLAWILHRGIGANVFIAGAFEPEKYKSSLLNK